MWPCTIALGAALAQKHGDGNYYLSLNDADISVEGKRDERSDGEESYLASLKSPNTSSKSLSTAEVNRTLALFGYDQSDLATYISPAHVSGGADRYVIALNKRAALSAMSYDIDAGRVFMRERNIVTVMFVFSETKELFHVRNAFASGGVLEDPATGAAAAAFSGYLRDIEWPSNGKLTLIQGEDMGARSIITTEFSSEAGSSIKVSGATRYLE